MNEEERRDRKNDEEIKRESERSAKKDNKSKFSVIARRLALIIHVVITLFIKLFPIILAAICITALIHIFDMEGDHTITGVASSIVIDRNTHIEEADNGDGYYFQIDKKLIDEYLEELNRAFHYGYWYDVDPDFSGKEDYVYDPDNPYIDKNEGIIDWFQTEDYEPYLIKMIKAQIASSYPKLGDYEGYDDLESERNKEFGNKKDLDKNYVAQGIVEIHRTPIDEDGNSLDSIELEYIPLEELRALIEANNEEALEYFSFLPETKLIYYATWKKVVVKINGEEVSSTYELQENSASYTAAVNTCSMPYNFLFALLQEGKSPEWVMAVVDLLLEESEVILMIQDQLNIVTETRTEIAYHAEQTIIESYTSMGDEDSGFYWVSTGTSEPSYRYPVGEPEITVIETITYTNTAVVFIKKAETWCIDLEQEAVPVHTFVPGEEYITKVEHDAGELAGLRIF